MKTRLVETVTSNEDHVRLRIYDGEIPVDAAGEALIDLYRRQARNADERAAAAILRNNQGGP